MTRLGARLLLAACLGSLVAAPARGVNAAESACDGNRLQGFLDRLEVEGAGSSPGVSVTLAPDGSILGLAWTRSPGTGLESQLAFSASFDEPTLLRNPERPQLFSVAMARNQLSTDLAPGDGGAPLAVVLNPTLEDDPPPEALLRLDNRSGSAREAGTRPGRGLDHLVAPCHGRSTDRGFHALQVLLRTVRAEVAGAATVGVAIFPGGSPGTFRVDVHPRGPGGESRGRLSAEVTVRRTPAGELLDGTLRLLPACVEGAPPVGCSDLRGAASLRVVPPTFRGVAPPPGVGVSTDGEGAPAVGSVEIDWRELLDGTTWRRPRLSPEPSLALELARAPLLVALAHPDDEVLLAPLLGEACVELGGECALLVVTRGEAGSCDLPGGCGGDLAAVRAEEMADAAALFDATLELWELPDGSAPDPAGVRGAWAAASGGEAALIDRLASAFADHGAATVVTFDPRHGSTCHPDHRALGGLVLEAVARLGDEGPETLLLETRPVFEGGVPRSFAPAVPGDGDLTSYRGDRWMVHLGAPAWEYLLRNAALHPSQLDARTLEALSAVPVFGRRVWLLEGDAAASGDPRYRGLCPGNGGTVRGRDRAAGVAKR